jgi:hypothetical protein
MPSGYPESEIQQTFQQLTPANESLQANAPILLSNTI